MRPTLRAQLQSAVAAARAGDGDETRVINLAMRALALAGAIQGGAGGHLLVVPRETFVVNVREWLAAGEGGPAELLDLMYRTANEARIPTDVEARINLDKPLDGWLFDSSQIPAGTPAAKCITIVGELENQFAAGGYEAACQTAGLPIEIVTGVGGILSSAEAYSADGASPPQDGMGQVAEAAQRWPGMYQSGLLAFMYGTLMGSAWTESKAPVGPEDFKRAAGRMTDLLNSGENVEATFTALDIDPRGFEGVAATVAETLVTRDIDHEGVDVSACIGSAHDRWIEGWLTGVLVHRSGKASPEGPAL